MEKSAGVSSGNYDHMSKDQRRLEGQFHRTAGGRLSFEIYYAVPDIMFEIEKILRSEFGCSKPETSIHGFDEIITRCHKGDIYIEVGWDTWSGFYMFADSEKGDELIRHMGEHLQPLVKDKSCEKFIHYW
jgi:hypothetical protein